jgi:hypothetical protein
MSSPFMGISEMYKYHIDTTLQPICITSKRRVKEKYSLLLRFSVNLKSHNTESSLTQTHAYLRIRQVSFPNIHAA